MDKKDAADVLEILKENYERGWERLGKCPREQAQEHKEANPEGEKYWRQLYVEALTTAINELR